KRTAAVVSETFIDLNGYCLAASDAEIVVLFLALAGGELSEDELAQWFRERIEPRSERGNDRSGVRVSADVAAHGDWADMLKRHARTLSDVSLCSVHERFRRDGRRRP